MEEQKLKEYYKFDEADLNANRNGHLSEQQLKHLDDDAKAYRKNARGAGIILFVIAAAGLVGGVIMAFTALSLPDKGGRIISGLTFGVVWSFIWGKLGIRLLKPSYPIQKFSINTARGRAKIVRHEDSEGNVDFVLHVGQHTFDVDDDIADVISQGDDYAVYYLEEIEAIISAEPISKK